MGEKGRKAAKPLSGEPAASPPDAGGHCAGSVNGVFSQFNTEKPTPVRASMTPSSGFRLSERGEVHPGEERRIE